MKTVLVDGHADTGTAGLVGAVTARASDLVVLVNLVELKNGKLGDLVVVLGLLGLGVGLLLALLGHTTSKSQHQVQSRLLLDVVIRKSAAVLELLTSEDKSLLIRGDTLLVLDLLLHILNGVRGLHIKSDGFARERLHKNLHIVQLTELDQKCDLILYTHMLALLFILMV